MNETKKQDEPKAGEAICLACGKQWITHGSGLLSAHIEKHSRLSAKAAIAKERDRIASELLRNLTP